MSETTLQQPVPTFHPTEDFAGYEEFSLELERAFDAAQEYAGETIARQFADFDAMLRDAEVTL